MHCVFSFIVTYQLVKLKVRPNICKQNVLSSVVPVTWQTLSKSCLIKCYFKSAIHNFCCIITLMLTSCTSWERSEHYVTCLLINDKMLYRGQSIFSSSGFYSDIWQPGLGRRTMSKPLALLFLELSRWFCSCELVFLCTILHKISHKDSVNLFAGSFISQSTQKHSLLLVRHSKLLKSKLLSQRLLHRSEPWLCFFSRNQRCPPQKHNPRQWEWRGKRGFWNRGMYHILFFLKTRTQNDYFLFKWMPLLFFLGGHYWYLQHQKADKKGIGIIYEVCQFKWLNIVKQKSVFCCGHNASGCSYHCRCTALILCNVDLVHTVYKCINVAYVHDWHTTNRESVLFCVLR